MKSHLKVILSVFILLGLSCKKSPTDPDVDSHQSGRRDYVWTEDTLKISKDFDLLAVRMWGDKSNNIWISVNGGGYIYNLWHYDGTSVTTDSVSRRILLPMGIFGLVSDDIWLASSDNEIWHYDGNQWSKFGTYIKPGYEIMTISNFWGKSRDDIYAVGSASDGIKTIGVIMHYNGKEWKFLDIPEIPVLFNDIRLRTSTNTFYVEGCTTGLPDSSKLYSLKDGFINEIYSTREIASLNNIGDEVYFVIGKKVYKIGNQGFEVWKDYSDQRFFNRIWGNSEVDCFHTTRDGIAHFNGQDLKVLYQSNNFICEALIFEKEVFFLSYNDATEENILIQGKLKEGNE